MPPALDLELIKTFLTVIEMQGFKPAAKQMNKTPAAVSQQIKRLEDILGKRVLERSNQGISLTSAGEVLKAKGQRLMSLNYELLGDLREYELSGQLNFGAPTDYAPTLLQKLLPLFQREFPQLSPSIVLEPSRLLRPRVSSGNLDMAIVAQEVGKSEGYALWTEEIAWFGTSKEEDGTPRVGVLGTDCILRDQALAGLAASGGANTLVLESAAVASLKDAVEAGFCQAFLPVSISDGLKRSTSIKVGTLNLTFSLVTSPHFDPLIAERI
jgi:DNA-binding transcriptional LysR family regulator